MRELLILLVVIAAIAILWWYLRQKSATSAEQGGYVNSSRRVAQRGARGRDVANGSITPEPGLLEDAASSAAGLPYARAADQMEEMTAGLATARREAERAAERLANRAAAALAAVQAAAASHGGAVPGDGTDHCPPGYPVKGAMTTMAFLTVDDPAYDQTVPDVCFQSVAAAAAAGFSEAGGQAGTIRGAAPGDVADPDPRDDSNGPE